MIVRPHGKANATVTPKNKLSVCTNYCHTMSFYGGRLLRMGFGQYSRDHPCLFLGIYSSADYDAVVSHPLKRYVFWNGGDVPWVIDHPQWHEALRDKSIEHACHNQQLADALAGIGITASIEPILFADPKDYPVSFVPSKTPHIYINVNLDREEEYGLPYAEDIFTRLPNHTLHVYGVDGTSHDNVVFHGRVPEEQMDAETATMQGCLRMKPFDGMSQIVIKAILRGQYPVVVYGPEIEKAEGLLREIADKTGPNTETIPRLNQWLDSLKPEKGAFPVIKSGPIKLYFALLNHGWIRREVASKQIPEMNKTDGVKLKWEDPAKTWGHPIYSNRNAIVKRFLSTDCDFLMMQDDDIFPLHNPAELVWANKDVIGCPAKVRTEHGTLDWVAYAKHPNGGGFVTVDLAQCQTWADLVPVDIVGTGLIIIKRRVLEGVIEKFPGVGAFTVENDSDGICEWGTDFAFCKRARAAGFEIYTTPHRVCEHFKELGLMDMDGYDNTDNMDTSNSKYEIAWGMTAIQAKDWEFIKKWTERYGWKNVMEFGSGLSSLLMSESANVLSYETDPDWADIIRAKANGNKLKIEMWDGVTAPSRNGDAPPDMVFIDGPVGKSQGSIGRDASYGTAVATGAKFIITHDSGRRDELWLADKYLRKKYDIIAKNGNHQQRCQLWRLREANAV